MNRWNIVGRVLIRKLRRTLYHFSGIDLVQVKRKPIFIDNLRYFLGISEDSFLGRDIRGEWEAHRFQHLLWLALDAVAERSKEQANQICKEISEWIEAYPPGYSVQWTCAMEAGIRVANWLIAISMLNENKLLPADFKEKFLNSVEQHGIFIDHNLEISVRRPPNNHYISNIAGLLYISIFCPCLSKSAKWKRLAVNELKEQIFIQTLEDGVCFENSLSYHRLTTEIFLYCAMLCRKDGINLGPGYYSRLKNMLCFVLFYLRPDGKAPNIGDNDEGCWHIFSERLKKCRNDHRYLLGLGALIFDQDEFNLYMREIPFGVKIAFLDEVKSKRIRGLVRERQQLSSKSFKEGGVYVMRNVEAFIFISTVNSHHHKMQLHKHNDIFSFELCIGNSPFIIDLGCYCYTLDLLEREVFRSTKAHNTVMIDNVEQHAMKDATLFALPRSCAVEVVMWQTNDIQDVFIGKHYGYKRLVNPVVHTRKIEFSKHSNRWILEDTFEGSGFHTFEWAFHFNPDALLVVHEISRSIVLTLNGRKLEMRVPKELQFSVARSNVSLKFGEKTETNSLICSFAAHLNTSRTHKFEIWELK